MPAFASGFSVREDLRGYLILVDSFSGQLILARWVIKGTHAKVKAQELVEINLWARSFCKLLTWNLLGDSGFIVFLRRRHLLCRMNQIELDLFTGDLSSSKQLLKIAVRHHSFCNSAKQSFYLLFFPG